MRQRMWDIVVLFPFDEIYLISFVNKFNFVNYIIRWKNSLHIIHVGELFKVQVLLLIRDEPVKKAHDQQI
jgi:hypothetical protein